MVLLCLFPLLTTNVFIATNERHFFREIEIDRLVNHILVNVIEKLHENAMEWPMLQKGVEETVDDTMQEQMRFPRHFPYVINYAYRLIPEKDLDEKNGRSKHILSLTITFTPIDQKQRPLNFPFELFIERKIPLGKDLPTDQKKEEKTQPNASEK